MTQAKPHTAQSSKEERPKQLTMATLRETAERCCKKVYIGTAVLPKQLFVYDHDDVVDGENNDTRTARPLIKCATISTVEPDDENLSSETCPTRYAQTITSEFNSVVIEHHLKWAPLTYTYPGPIHQSAPPTARLGKYDFHHVDTMVDYALEHNLHIKGHVLIWHVTSPPFLEDMSPSQVRIHVKRHIFTTMAYFKNRIKMWDVVNESLASDGTLVENVFYRKLGPTYIEDCFCWAHEADPTAFLIYNDNKVEGCGEGYDSDGHKNDEDGNNTTTNSKTVITKDDDDDDDDDATKRSKSPAPNQAKSDGFYNLLKSLVDKGVPIHGAGMQAHFNAGGIGAQRPPTPAMVKRQIARIGKLGLKVNISELDVRVSKLPAVDVAASEETDSGNASKCNGNNDANKDIRTIAQTQIYRDILSAALSEPAFDGIWLWGFTDRHTWVKNFYYDDAPLIFDENYNKKSSYYGVQEALKTLCPGGKVGELMGGEKGQCFLTSDINEEGRRWGHEWMQPEYEDNDGKKDTTKEGQPDWMQPS